MQKPEKQSEPSMEDILASIRKIIAEEPQPAPSEPVAPVDSAAAAAPPPAADLSDLLGEPTAPSPAGMNGATDSSNAHSTSTGWPFAGTREGSDSATAKADVSAAPSNGVASSSSPSLAESLANLASTGIVKTGLPGTDQVESDAARDNPAVANADGSLSSNTSPIEPAATDEETLVSRLKGFEASPSNRFGSLPADEPGAAAAPVFREIKMPERPEPQAEEIASEAEAAASDISVAPGIAEEAVSEPTPAEIEPAAAFTVPSAATADDQDNDVRPEPLADRSEALEPSTVGAEIPSRTAEISLEPGEQNAESFNGPAAPEIEQMSEVAPLPHMLGSDEPNELVSTPEIEPAPGVHRDLSTDAVAEPAAASLSDAGASAQLQNASEPEVADSDPTPQPSQPDVAVPVAAATVAAAQPPATSSPAIESALSELIRPIVVKWLDENAPGHIEAAVEKMRAEESSKA